MNLVEYLKTTHDNLKGREELEWSNTWIEKANENICNRILLIGDSTARMVRKTFSQLTGRPVDLIAHSGGLHDILFVRQVEAFFTSSKYKYSTIYIQLGHHSWWNENGNDYTDEDFECFKNDYILKSASNLNDNLNCSKELEHYAS